jgi:hypothetical protein
MSAYRGRLIFPKVIEIGRLDTATLAADGDYDPIMRERITSNRNRVDQARNTPRPEIVVRVRAQIETSSYQRMIMTGTGNAPDSFMVAVLLASELEEAGFIDSTTKQPLIKPTDRLIAVHEPDGSQILAVTDPPGLFATMVQPAGFGFGAGGYNLVEVTFSGRPSGTTGGGGAPA